MILRNGVKDKIGQSVRQCSQQKRSFGWHSICARFCSVQARPDMLLAQFTRIHRYHIEISHEVKPHNLETINFPVPQRSSSPSPRPQPQLTNDFPMETPRYQETPRVEPRRFAQNPPILNSRLCSTVTCSMRLMQVRRPSIY